jgi:hypothetical protein
VRLENAIMPPRGEMLFIDLKLQPKCVIVTGLVAAAADQDVWGRDGSSDLAPAWLVLDNAEHTVRRIGAH